MDQLSSLENSAFFFGLQRPLGQECDRQQIWWEDLPLGGRPSPQGPARAQPAAGTPGSRATRGGAARGRLGVGGLVAPTPGRGGAGPAAAPAKLTAGLPGSPLTFPSRPRARTAAPPGARAPHRPPATSARARALRGRDRDRGRGRGRGRPTHLPHRTCCSGRPGNGDGAGERVSRGRVRLRQQPAWAPRGPALPSPWGSTFRPRWEQAPTQPRREGAASALGTEYHLLTPRATEPGPRSSPTGRPARERAGTREAGRAAARTRRQRSASGSRKPRPPRERSAERAAGRNAPASSGGAMERGCSGAPGRPGPPRSTLGTSGPARPAPFLGPGNGDVCA